MARWRMHRGRGERGAVAVETALVSVVLITMFYGVVEASFLFRDSIAISAASRAGARQGASQPRVNGFRDSTRDQVQDALRAVDISRVTKVWIFKARSDGTPQSGSFSSCTTSCIRYTGSATGLQLVADNWSYSSQNACLGATGPPDDFGVYVEYTYRPRLGLFFNGLMLKQNTVMRLEPVTTGACR